MKKTMIAILVFGLIFMAGLIFYEQGRVSRLKAEAKAEKEKIAELEKQAKMLDGQVKTLAELNKNLEAKFHGLEKEKAELIVKLIDSEKRLAEIQGQVEAMPPDQMVQTTRRILKDNGVEKIDVGARFSLSAFQRNTSILLQWEEFSLAKIPALEQKSQVQEKEILNLQNQVFLWKESDRLWRQKNTLWLEEKTSLNALLNNYQKQINSQKRQKIWTLLLGLAAGFGIHALVGK
jgi:AICAR transformylase/IMP cyclohydrolase PurH